MQQRGNKESHTEKRAETHARGFERLRTNRESVLNSSSP